MLEKICRRLPKMAKDASVIIDDILQIDLLFNRTEINLETAVTGYIRTMMLKKLIPIHIVNALEEYVSMLELDYKTILEVPFVDYDITDSESSSGHDSPPEAKRTKSDLRGASKERYFHALEKKMRIFLFYSDIQNRTLFEDHIWKKICFRKFLLKSKLRRSEVIGFIVPLP